MIRRTSLLVVSLGVLLAPALAAGKERPAATAREATERGIDFVQADAVKWRSEKKCASCHHGVMTIWALSEARQAGFQVDSSYLAEAIKWTKERLDGIAKPRDPRPGWNMISTPAIYLSVMAKNEPGQKLLTAAEQAQIAEHAARHLEDDGSVLTPATMNPPMAKNGPPPVFESREVLTLFAYLAMDPDASESVRAGRGKAGAWLDQVKPGVDTQATAFRLLRQKEDGASKRDLRRTVDSLIGLQHADAGWGQLKELPSDGYATGLALYALSVAGVDRKRPEIQRAVSFLVENQKQDGSWAIKPRAHPGVTPMSSPVPITHIGSAWAVIGLVRSLPRRDR